MKYSDHPVHDMIKHHEAMKEAERKMIEALVEFARQAAYQST